MKIEESMIDKTGKIIGLVIFFIGLVFLITVFLLAYGIFTDPATALSIPDFSSGEGTDALMEFLKPSLILSAKFLALSILGLVGSWVCNKGIMLIKTPKEKTSKEKSLA